MAGAAAETGTAEAAAEGSLDEITLLRGCASRDAPMRRAGAACGIGPLEWISQNEFTRAGFRAANKLPEMNDFERQSRQAADQDILSDEIAEEISHIPTEVIDITDAPPLAPPAPLAPERGAHHHHQPDADDVPGRARTDHRRNRTADARPPVRRRLQSLLGDHGVSARRDRGGAGVRHAQRHLWPPRHGHHLARPCSWRARCCARSRGACRS